MAREGQIGCTARAGCGCRIDPKNAPRSGSLRKQSRRKQSAEKVARVIKSIRLQCQPLLPALHVPEGDKLPDDQRLAKEEIAYLAEELVHMLVPRREDKEIKLRSARLNHIVVPLLHNSMLPSIANARLSAAQLKLANHIKELSSAMLLHDNIRSQSWTSARTIR